MDRQRANPFVELLELLADLMILNILFLLCCLPVVTVGASLAGLCYAAEKLRRQEGRPAANFFRGFRVNFRQATIFWIIFLCLLVFLFLDLYFLVQNGESGLYPLLLGLVLLWLIFTSVYFYPLLVRFDNTLPRHIRNAFLLSLTHLGRTICLTALALAPLLIWTVSAQFLLYTAVFWLLVGFSAAAYCSARLLRKVFSTQMPEERED